MCFFQGHRCINQKCLIIFIDYPYLIKKQSLTRAVHILYTAERENDEFTPRIELLCMLREEAIDQGQPAPSWLGTVGQSHYLPLDFRVRISSFCKSWLSSLVCEERWNWTQLRSALCVCIRRAAVRASLKTCRGK